MKIILGTANFKNNYGILKNKMKEADFIEILDICKKNKINKIDTALGYKDISKILNSKKNEWQIFTKIKISKKPYTNEFEKIIKNYPNFKTNLLLHNTLDLKNDKFKNFIIKIKKKYKINIGI